MENKTLQPAILICTFLFLVAFGCEQAPDRSKGNTNPPPSTQVQPPQTKVPPPPANTLSTSSSSPVSQAVPGTPREASPSSQENPPGSLEPDKPQRKVHYDEIDQARLRRMDTVYIIAEDEPYTGLAYRTHPDGSRSFEINYKAGVSEGLLTQYHPNGNPSFQVYMTGNKAIGTAIGWYPDSTKKSEYPYKDGVVHGTFTEWFNSGQRALQATYNNGKVQGEIKGWYLNGTPYTAGEIRGLEPKRITAWYAPGKKWKETGWRNGKLWGYTTNGQRMASSFPSSVTKTGS